MPFVPNYANDIFISYAHVDNEKLPGAAEGWINTFIKFLRVRLDQQLGRGDKYSLWSDHDLHAGATVSDQLIRTIEDTAILVVVLSPGYIASDWCQRERNGFLTSIPARAGRVIAVEREPVEEADWPQELRDLKPFRFWTQTDLGAAAPRILGCPECDSEYYARMADLSLDVVRVLKQLKPRDPAIPAQREVMMSSFTPASDVAPAVFLAIPTYDVEPQWNEVKRYLDQAGIRVLPGSRYPIEPEAFRAMAERDIERSSRFVQLLSPVPFRKPALSNTDYNELQLEIARRMGKPVMQWRHPDLDIELIGDQRHKDLLNGADVRAEVLEEFKRAVRKRSFEKPVEATPKPINAFVFVNVDARDRGLANEVCTRLDRLGAAWALPRSTSETGIVLDPGAARRDLEKNLQDCDALIIIYGKSDVDWVRDQLRACHKAIAGRTGPLNALAVFEGPPEEKAPLDMKLAGMRIVDCRKGLSDAELRDLLQLARRGDAK